MVQDMSPLAMSAGMVTWCLVLLAYPSQILQLRKVKKAEGVSLTLFVVSFISFAIWIPYGMEIGNKVIVTSNIIGGVLAGVIVAQTVYYRYGQQFILRRARK